MSKPNSYTDGLIEKLIETGAAEKTKETRRKLAAANRTIRKYEKIIKASEGKADDIIEKAKKKAAKLLDDAESTKKFADKAMAMAEKAVKNAEEVTKINREVCDALSNLKDKSLGSMVSFAHGTTARFHTARQQLTWATQAAKNAKTATKKTTTKKVARRRRRY